MNHHIYHHLTDLQCEQIALLHTRCAENAEHDKKAPDEEREPSVLSLVLPEPNTEEEDAFYGLYYIEGTLISFLSVFCPDKETAEISGFTHPSYRNRGYFSLLLEEAKKETENLFGNVSFLYQCLSGDPDTKAFCDSRRLVLSFSECLMKKTVSKIPSPVSSSVFLSEAGEEDRKALISLHREAFEASLAFAEPYIDTILEDAQTTSYKILSETRQPVGLLHLTMDETGRAAYFMGLGILPRFRRMGYGEAALIRLMALLKEGCTLLLHVSTSNTAAFALYTKLGFQIQSKLDYFVSAP